MKRFLKWIGLSVLFAAGLLAVFSVTPWGASLRSRLPLCVVRVVGCSMEPTFYSGDLLLFARGPVELGDIVLVCSLGETWVKRLVEVRPYMPGNSVPLLRKDPAGVMYRLCGDNTEQSDMRWVFPSAVRGWLVYAVFIHEQRTPQAWQRSLSDSG